MSSSAWDDILDRFRLDRMAPEYRNVYRQAVREPRQLVVDLCEKLARRLARAYERRRMAQAARQPDELALRVARAQAILFVCTGNIIRSAFAAELLRSLRHGRPDVMILSAGLDATDGPAHPTAVRCARRFGVDLTLHRTHRLDQRDIEKADVLFAMEINHVVEIHRRFPQNRHKVYLLGCLNADAQDVADPVHSPTDAFEACFDQIDLGVRRIVDLLPPTTRSSAPTGTAV
jgi:protein-tyrosine-phosphatase